MTFNDNARLDTSQVQSGGSGGGGMAPGGIAVGGIGGLILMILMVLFGGNLTNSGNNGGTTGAGSNTGVDTSQVTGGTGSSGDDAVSQQISQCKTGKDANNNDTCRVIATVNSVQAFWRSYLPQKTGTNYSDVPTVLFSGSTSSGCGTATSAMGPFYCPLDRKVYIDVGFFQDLSSTYGADTGALAKEYVVAHEYGHHVQDLLGLLGRAQQDPQGAQSGSVRTELQADCFGGIWVHWATTTKDADGNTFMNPITDSDIKSALSAASAVGDDRIQQKAQGRVTPETWTHGSANARQYWFMQGYQSGDINQCDTFNAPDLHE